MKITRCGHYKNRGTTILVDEDAEPVLVGSRLKFQIQGVLDPNPMSDTTHDYTVELSSEELRKILDELVTCAFGEPKYL